MKENFLLGVNMNNKNKVFLSSSQFEDEFKIEREILPILFEKEPLSSIFEIFKIETNASGLPIDKEYLRNIRDSHIVVLLIDSIIREAVRNEIDEAKKLKIPIFGFIRDNINRPHDATSFIKDVQSFVTTTNYNSIHELTKKIEDSLLSFYSPRLNKKETDEDLKGSKDFDINERSLKIAIFALSKKSNRITTESILPLLISECLIGKEATEDEIKNKIPVMDKTLITTSLDHMLSDFQIIKKGTKFTLAAHKTDAILKIAQTIDAQESQVKAKIASKYYSNTGFSKSQFQNYVDKCLALIIYKTTVRVTDYHSSIGELEYDSLTLKKNILDSVIL
jgi:hypothetical protein